MAAVTPFDLASELGVLSVGRDPAGQSHSTPNGNTSRPSGVTDGAPLLDSVVAMVSVTVREVPAFRTGRLFITTLDAAAETFTTTIGGNAVAYADPGGQTLSAVLVAIAAAINADGPASALVTATAVDDNDVESATDATQVLLQGVGLADYTLDFSTGGSSVTDATADPSGCSVIVFGQRAAAPNTTPDTTWRAYAQAGTIAVAQDNYMDRWTVAGLSRLYVMIVPGTITRATDGAGVTAKDPTIDVAPCIVESS